jgi:hypothetical protein
MDRSAPETARLPVAEGPPRDRPALRHGGDAAPPSMPPPVAQRRPVPASPAGDGPHPVSENTAPGALEPRQGAPLQEVARIPPPLTSGEAGTGDGPSPPFVASSGLLTIETELGGTFYLLNLAIFLGLYGDFTTPLRPGIALDPWDYLALLGRALGGRSLARDPIWMLLARLARRDPRVPPGQGFRPPRAWRAARAWLEPFEAAGVWRWSAAGGTLRIIHPAGFAAVAVPRTDAPAVEQVAAELARLRARMPPALASAPAPRRTAMRPEPRLPLARWVTRLAAYADARLRLAVAAATDNSLLDLLLRVHARVLVTHTHVEVVLPLRELPLAVRFAGLDRTPGWLPAAGRFVSIEFE